MTVRLLVFSDSHNNRYLLNRILMHEMPVDYIIHCGDGVGDLFHMDIPDGVKVVKVSGNVDLHRGYDIERIDFLVMNGFKIMVAHGDLFRVQDDYGLILSEGKRQGADAVFFGHTHKKFLSDGKPVLFNPGPANKGYYGIVTLGEKNEFSHRVFSD